MSWAWLAPKPNTKNPTTGLRGSQVFFHDTKNGQFQLLPVAYFAERILRWPNVNAKLYALGANWLKGGKKIGW